ncbi:MAG: cation transporter dimerization domain-containing protein, partial [Bacteroidales bacterium]
YLILIQATPPEIDLNKIKNTLENIPAVENIHHVHAWKLNDNVIHFECHIDLKEDYRISETESVLNLVKTVLKEDFNIEHTTIQFEYNCCSNKSMIY